MTLKTLLLLQNLLLSQQIRVSADDAEIQEVLTAKAELSAAIEAETLTVRTTGSGNTRVGTPK